MVATPVEARRRWDAHAAWGGLAFVVLFVVGVAVAGDPGTSNGPKVAHHFASDRTSVLVGMYLAGLGLVAFFVWVWSLRDIFLGVGERALAAAVLAAGVIVIAVEFPVVAIETALAYISDQRVDPSVARALYDLSQVFSYTDWFPLALMFAIIAMGAKKTRFIPTWLGWTAGIIVLLSLIAAQPTFGLDVPVSLLVFAWIALVSVLLGLRPR